MPSNDQFIRLLAAWALVHETADEGWKAAIERGVVQAPGEMGAGPEAFVNGLSALVADEKERLKASLSAAGSGPAQDGSDLGVHLDELRFEVAELRGQIESMQASLDALLRRSEG
ncbi:MAG: hypothetical protein CVT67_11920 [Actinobacteria bacterium HGW-Actinobacteria-7]|nr:MAG: hypothetical protein CVT67_11920 [Actinobacteria bacterium HGW-Actinobacteria-7]